MTCPQCGGPFVRHGGESETLVGIHYVGKNHQHDNNCRKRVYVCEQGHQTQLSIVRRCNDHMKHPPVCDWTGKRECFCHRAEKIEVWPDAPGPKTRADLIMAF